MSAAPISTLLAEGSRCAIHREIAATGICRRCGAFMCGECSRVAPDDERAQVCVACWNPECARLREPLLRHEAGLHDFGSVQVLAGLLLATLAFPNLAIAGRAILEGHHAWLSVLVTTPLAGFALALVRTGIGLRRLEPRYRREAKVLCALGLLLFPIGTLLCGYGLYLLLSERTDRVLSARWGEVIAATPNLKYRAGNTLAILILVVVAILLFIIGFRPVD